MDIITFMIAMYCLIEDHVASKQLRKRDPQPTLRNSEVLIIEVRASFSGSLQKVIS
jgi:hypothetical protein